jgi:hypothetical protein
MVGKAHQPEWMVGTTKASATFVASVDRRLESSPTPAMPSAAAPAPASAGVLFLVDHEAAPPPPLPPPPPPPPPPTGGSVMAPRNTACTSAVRAFAPARQP